MLCIMVAFTQERTLPAIFQVELHWLFIHNLSPYVYQHWRIHGGGAGPLILTGGVDNMMKENTRMYEDLLRYLFCS